MLTKHNASIKTKKKILSKIEHGKWAAYSGYTLDGYDIHSLYNIKYKEERCADAQTFFLKKIRAL
jgi:hypothetical protein